MFPLKASCVQWHFSLPFDEFLKQIRTKANSRDEFWLPPTLAKNNTVLIWYNDELKDNLGYIFPLWPLLRDS